MPRRLRPASVFAIALLVVLAAASARAADIPCGPVDPDVIHIDGLLDDWNEVSGIDAGGRERDFSFTVKCNYDARSLYLAIDVRDDYLVRTKEAKPAEDHLQIVFGARGRVERLTIYPADLNAKIPHKVHWSSPKKPVKGVEVAESLQPAGWSVEARIPLAQVPGWSPNAPLIKLAVAGYDCDSKAKPAIEATVETAPTKKFGTLGSTEFAEGHAAIEAFLKDRNLRKSDVMFDRPARVGGQGNARLVLAPPYLAVISDEYAYLQLPVASRADVKEVRVADLAGDGRDFALVRYVERGGGGSREVLGAYRVVADGLRRTFGVEVGKQVGTSKLSTKVKIVRRGKRRGVEILIEPLPAVGFTEATYQEAPAADLVPIVTPWTTPPRQRFQFRGEEYFRVE
jgi:hypothetical protein